MSFENEEKDYILPEGYNEDDDFDLSDEDDDFESQFDDDQEDTPSSNEEEVEKIKIRYNHEDLEIPMNEAQELLQKGYNYDKIHSRLQEFESDPRLELVNNLAMENDMSVEEFLEVFNETRQQSQIEELQEAGIPPEIAEEILEARKERLERRRIEEQQQSKAQEEQEFLSFFDTFKDLNGRDFIPGQDDLPQEVWQAQAEGIPLRFAYMQHYNKSLQDKVKILEQNNKNSERSPIGATSRHGSSDPGRTDEFLEGFNSI